MNGNKDSPDLRKTDDESSWREFELLVARIEKMLAPTGAKIVSPDKIPDKVSGQLREVDASIRYTVGSVPVLITIECRDRSRKQDVQWLEQIKSKKEGVGAHQTIVVAKNGLTEPAMKFAKAHGIEVRSIAEITEPFILACANSVQITSNRLNFKNLTYNVQFFRLPEDEDRATPLNLSSEVRDLIKNNDAFTLDRKGDDVTLANLFHECLDGAEWQIRDALNQDDEIGADLIAEINHGNIEVDTEAGKRFIKAIQFSAIFFMESKPFPPLKHVKYLDEGGGKIISFSETIDPETGQGVTVQFGWDSDGKILSQNEISKNH